MINLFIKILPAAASHKCLPETVTESDVNEAIAVWLKHAKQRRDNVLKKTIATV
jgi:hypothetical protein